MLFVLMLSVGCASLNNQVSQGVTGQVVWVSGNRMPGPDRQLPPPEPVQRWVLFTPVLTMGQMPEGESGLYPSLPEEPVDSVQTDTKGNFSIALPAGTYSVFTREDDGYFANKFNEKSQVNPVNVSDGSVSDVTIEINYSAVY